MTPSIANRLSLWMDRIKSGFWGSTVIIVAGAIVLALLMRAIDGRAGSYSLPLWQWMSQLGNQGARVVLSTIAASTITVAGVIFSITIVALSTASAQFGPRLLREFLRSGHTQWVLGVFIGCFVYNLVTLGQVPGDSSPLPIPALSVLVGMAFGIFSILMLIFYIHHTARMIRAPVLIDLVGRESMQTFDNLLAAGDDEDMSFRFDEDELEGRAKSAVVSTTNGYIQVVDYPQLVRLAREENAVVRMQVRSGHYLVEGQKIADIYPEQDPAERENGRYTDCLTIADERTSTQDVEFALHQLVEIAVRSLSPGINDPFTAIHCIDQISASLARLADRRLPSNQLGDEDGRLRVITAGVGLGGIFDSAFNQIRQHASGHPAVAIHLMDVLGVLAGLDCRTEFRDRISRHVELIHGSCSRGFDHDSDREDFEGRYLRVREILGRPGSGDDGSSPGDLAAKPEDADDR